MKSIIILLTSSVVFLCSFSDAKLPKHLSYPSHLDSEIVFCIEESLYENNTKKALFMCRCPIVLLDTAYNTEERKRIAHNEYVKIVSSVLNTCNDQWKK